MIVPQYWAEGRIQHKQPKRQITVRRFGWSDTSQDDAQIMADERASEAMQRILNGEKLRRRDFKEAYGGADGIPIREEIISTQGDTIITRNSYGALCLNTPNVLFVDVDFDLRPRFSFGCGMFSLMLVTSIICGLLMKSFIAFGLGAALFYFGIHLFIGLLNKHHQRKVGDPATHAMQRIRQFSADHPDWHLRAYQTPAGYRILIMHTVFDSADSKVSKCFEQLKADPIYVQMCLNQHCFRARVSPKPWRIGISKNLRPRPGVWPVKPEHLPNRQKWVQAYDDRATDFASCRFVESLGSGQLHPDTEAVRQLHDNLCKAHSNLPIA